MKNTKLTGDQLIKNLKAGTRRFKKGDYDKRVTKPRYVRLAKTASFRAGFEKTAKVWSPEETKKIKSKFGKDRTVQTGKGMAVGGAVGGGLGYGAGKLLKRIGGKKLGLIGAGIGGLLGGGYKRHQSNKQLRKDVYSVTGKRLAARALARKGYKNIKMNPNTRLERKYLGHKTPY